MHTGAGAYTDPTYQSPRSRASRGTPTGLRSTSVEASTHRSRPTHRRAGADQRLSQATHFMAFMAAFMAFFAKTALFASAPTVFIAFIAAAFMAFFARTVPFASPAVFIAFMAAAFMAFFAKTVLFASPAVFIAFIARRMAFFIAGAGSAAAFFIAFAMARREVSEETGTTQSTRLASGLHRLHR